MPIGPLLTTLAPLAAQFAAGQIQRAQSQGDIARQNAYNSPAQQVARLREAGLPFAAYEKGQAGNQSALPETNKGLGSYITSQTQLKQLEILKAEIRLKNAEADESEARRSWLLSGRGEDRAGTNLTANLGFEQGMRGAQTKGAELTNKITGLDLGNRPLKIQMENTEAAQRIANAYQQFRIGEKHIEGAELENKAKAIANAWTPKMNEAQLKNLTDQHDLNITEKGLKKLQLELARATQAGNIAGTDARNVQSMLSYDVAKEYFEDYQQYHKFVEEVQREFDKGAMGWIKDPLGRMKAIMSLAYTTISSPNGGGAQGLINFLK